MCQTVFTAPGINSNHYHTDYIVDIIIIFGVINIFYFTNKEGETQRG